MLDDVAARLEALETRLAYQDQTIEELNAALTGQWQEIDKLRRQLVLLEAELRATAEAGLVSGAPEPPPPHY